jgi:hypothetical protein
VKQKVLAFNGDLESSSSAAKTATKKGVAKQPHKKGSVGINPWKLARLNVAEAVKVAAKAREEASSTTIIRPITGSSQTEDSSLESSRDVSGEITMAAGKLRKHDLASLTGKERWLLMKDVKSVTTVSRPGIIIPTGGAYGSPQSLVLPLPLEARNGFKCSPSRFSGEMRTSSYPGSSDPGSSYQSCSQLASPDILLQGSPDEIPTTFSTPIERPATVVKENVNFSLQTSESSSTDASAGESGDENGGQKLKPTLNKSNLDTTVVTPNEKVAVWEDGTQENVKPRITTNSGARSLGSRGSRNSRESPGGEFKFCGRSSFLLFFTEIFP